MLKGKKSVSMCESSCALFNRLSYFKKFYFITFHIKTYYVVQNVSGMTCQTFIFSKI